MLMLLDDRDSPLPLFFNLFFQGMCWGFFSPTWPQRPPSSPSFLRRLRFVGPSLYLLHRSYPCVQTTGFFYIGICGQIVFLRSRERGSPWPCCSCQTAFRTWRRDGRKRPSQRSLLHFPAKAQGGCGGRKVKRELTDIFASHTYPCIEDAV